MISQRAIDLIIECEVSSRAYYEKHYRHPEWPGGASGVTIAVGYDLGYTDLNKERQDWSDKCQEPMLKVMDRCLGVHGSAAHELLPLVRPAIDIPWDSATAVFLERDVPKWTATVCAAIPGADKLSPDCLGALVSLAYNRGASFNASGDRFREMRDIRAHVVAGELAKVPGDIRAMKRLWPGVHGLQARRDAEAKLFEDGLKQSSPVATKPVATEAPAKTLAPPPPSSAEHGSAAGPIVVAGGAAKQAAASGWSPTQIAMVIAAGVIAAVVVWLIVRSYRKSQPVLARAKDIATQGA